MSICLNMIVRDEAAVIERCLASVRPYVDYWVIVDTGSADDTPQRITAAMVGIPGELHHRPWRNFGHNRTEALNLAKPHGDFLLFIDADETLGTDGSGSFSQLSGPAYSLEARFNKLSYDRVSLVSTALSWRWEGVLHEYLECDQAVTQPRVPGFWINVTPDGARSADPKKYEKDAHVLLEAFRAEPNNSRYAFYLAQSYRDCGQLENALAYYKVRASMGGWDEEVWYAQFECARMAELLGRPHEEIIAGYLQAYQLRPQRAESLARLANYCRGRSEWHNAYLFGRTAAEIPVPTDRLFVDLSIYHWFAKDELALAAFYTGRYAEAESVWQVLLASPLLPESERARIQRNISFIPR